MANEALTLDGLSLNDAASGWYLESLEMPPPRKRAEWVQSADMDGSALVRDPQFENREITVRLRHVQQASMNLALDKIAALVDKLEESERQEHGLAMTWSPADSTRTVTFYVLSGEIDGMPIITSGEGVGWFQKSPTLSVKLTCKPFWYGTEVVLSQVTGTTPVIATTVPSVPGDVPAEGRLIVTDNAGQQRRFVEWGAQSFYYDAATSLIIDSDNMVTSGYSGTQTTRTGAYDPNASGNNVVRATIYATPFAVCSTGDQTHKGDFRVRARVYPGSSSVRVRLKWQVGDGPFRANPYASPPIVGDFVEVDLGVISVPPVPQGTHRWVGIIEAYGLASDTIDVDSLFLIPVDDGYGRVRASVVYEDPTTFSARDDFDTGTAGVLAGRVAPVGGTWAGAGSGTDFSWDPAFKWAYRQTNSEASDLSGRYETLGTTNYTNILVQAGLRASAGYGSNCQHGLIARYVDTNNWLMAGLNSSAGADTVSVFVRKRVAGTVTSLYQQQLYGFDMVSGYVSIRVLADTSGRWFLWVYVGNNAPSAPAAYGYDATLATGGALATGKVGMYDVNASSKAFTRYIAGFMAAVPADPAAISTSQSLEVRSNTTIRENTAGTVWGRVPSYRGSRFFIQPAGDENRTTRVAVLARRIDLDAGASAGVSDSTHIQVAYTPRGLAVPR